MQQYRIRTWKCVSQSIEDQTEYGQGLRPDSEAHVDYRKENLGRVTLG